MDVAVSMWFHLLVAVPLAGCASIDVVSRLSAAQEQAICKLLQHGRDAADQGPCCIDLTDAGAGGPDANPLNRGLHRLAQGGFEGRLVAGVNYWSASPLLHNASASSFRPTGTRRR